MRRMLLLSASLILTCASLAFAQGGVITLSPDPEGLGCLIQDDTPRLCSVYVVHLYAPGVTASEWAISDPECLEAVYLSDSSPFGVYVGAGPFNPGKSVGYGICLASPIHVATLQYFCQGLTPPCCLQQVIPHLISGGPHAVDCNATLVPAYAGAIWWHSNGCPCTIGTEDTTWGRVKAMFE